LKTFCELWLRVLSIAYNNCIPRRSAYILTLYDNITLNSIFCDNNEFNFESLIEKECSEKCSNACKQTFFRIVETKTHESQSNEDKYIIYVNLYIQYNTHIPCVCPLIDSAPGHHTDMRSVSLEPVGPEVCKVEKNFPKSGRITQQKCFATNAF